MAYNWSLCNRNHAVLYFAQDNPDEVTLLWDAIKQQTLDVIKQGISWLSHSVATNLWWVQHDEKKFMKKTLMQELRNDFQQLELYY